MPKARIDLDRCERAMRNIKVTGSPEPRGGETTPAALIEEAIAKITADPENALMERYMGLKNYAHWIHQREDHQYGYGPKHGCIVFEIARTSAARENKIPLGEDEIYLLECIRDFGYQVLAEDERGRQAMGNLCTAIEIHKVAAANFALVRGALEAARVESQAPAPKAVYLEEDVQA
jgi:hypothetical protein